MSEGNTMPFLAHLAALRTHLMRASAYILSGAVIAFAAMDWIFNSVLLAPKESNFITYRLFCEAGTYLGLPSLCSEIVPPSSITFPTAAAISGLELAILPSGSSCTSE